MLGQLSGVGSGGTKGESKIYQNKATIGNYVVNFLSKSKINNEVDLLDLLVNDVLVSGYPTNATSVSAIINNSPMWLSAEDGIKFADNNIEGFNTFLSACHGNKMYLFRGSNASTLESLCINLENNTSSVIANCISSIGLDDVPIVSAPLGDFLYFFDVYVSGSTRRSYKYDVVNDTWQQITNTPESTRQGFAIAYNDRIYIFVASKIFEYNPINDNYNEWGANDSAVTYACSNGVLVGDNVYYYKNESSVNKCFVKYKMLEKTTQKYYVNDGISTSNTYRTSITYNNNKIYQISWGTATTPIKTMYEWAIGDNTNNVAGWCNNVSRTKEFTTYNGNFYYSSVNNIQKSYEGTQMFINEMDGTISLVELSDIVSEEIR